MKDQIIQYIEKNYPVLTERPWAKYPENVTFKALENKKWFGLIMPVKRKNLGPRSTENNSEQTGFEKMFGLREGMQTSQSISGAAAADGDEIVNIINVKADSEFIYQITQTPGYFAGYHMNKENWLSILLDGTVPFEQICDCIDASYEMVTDTPTKRIYEAVKKIPKGHVATYAQVAAMAGNPKMSRAVGNALHKNPDPDHIPCFRVVNAKGELAGAFAFGGADVQADRLREDGVEVIDNQVDLNKYGISDNLM